MQLYILSQNSIHEEIKCRLQAINVCHYSVQTLLSSRLLSKNLKVKIHKTIILPVMLHGCKTWSHLHCSIQRVSIETEGEQTFANPDNDEDKFDQS